MRHDEGAARSLHRLSDLVALAPEMDLVRDAVDVVGAVEIDALEVVLLDVDDALSVLLLARARPERVRLPRDEIAGAGIRRERLDHERIALARREARDAHRRGRV